MELGQYNLKKPPQWEFETRESQQMFYSWDQIYHDIDTYFAIIYIAFENLTLGLKASDTIATIGVKNILR